MGTRGIDTGRFRSSRTVETFRREHRFPRYGARKQINRQRTNLLRSDDKKEKSSAYRRNNVRCHYHRRNHRVHRVAGRNPELLAQRYVLLRFAAPPRFDRGDRFLRAVG